MNKHTQSLVLGFALLCISAGVAMTLKAFSLQAQIVEQMVMTADGTMKPAGVGDGFADEEVTTFQEPAIGEAEWTDPFVAESASVPSDTSTQSETVPTEEGQVPNSYEGKNFFRAGKEAPVTNVSSSVSIPTPVEPETPEPEPEIFVPTNTETGTVLGTDETATPEDTQEIATPVTPPKASVVSFITKSTPFLVIVVVVVGSAMYFFFLRKKAPSMKKLGGIAPTPIAPPASVEQSSPRLEQALKAIQAEQNLATPPTIPKEGSSPSAPAPVNHA